MQVELLTQLLEVPGPSGYEQPIQQVVREVAHAFADEVRTDLHGNVLFGRNPSSPMRVMLAGHCDQLGMLVTHIDESGFVYSQPIGGWDSQQLLGQKMKIWTAQGPLTAVIARKPIHLLEETERNQGVRMIDLWLDLGVKNAEEARSLVQIGDPVTLELGARPLRNRLMSAPAMDDRAGLWVVLEALRRCGPELRCAAWGVSTVAEEIGLRGAQTSAYGIDPQIGIAVDVTHASDCPTIDKRDRGLVQLGAGPVIFRGPNMNPRVFELLVDTARRHQLPYQLCALGRAASNDSNVIQVTRQGVATGLVAIPCRYMHSPVETISLDDLEVAAQLLAHVLDRIDDKTVLIP